MTKAGRTPMTTSREIRLKARPVGMPKPSDFDLATVELPAPGDGEIQVKNLWMSVDPYMRGRMNDAKSYAAPFELGQAMNGGAVGQVRQARHHVAAQHAAQLVGRDGVVLAGADPRRGHVAQAALLHLVDQARQAGGLVD